MTASRTWKQAEQFWAELHGETRSGPTGRDTCDITHFNCPVGIEHKLQAKRTLRSEDIAQARENAAKLHLPWVLILHTKGTERLADDLIVMDATTYLALITGKLDFEYLPASTHDLARDLLEDV